MEPDIWQAYQASHPGQVQVLGADLWNGTEAQVQSFKDRAGTTFPLLLDGALEEGGNLALLYGPFYNYIVIDKQGIVRYHAYLLYPSGHRYHLDEILAVIDDLVSPPAAVGDDPLPGAGTLFAAPNPFRARLDIHVLNPGPDPLSLRIVVLDLRGRPLRQLVEDGVLPACGARVGWDGRDESGRPVPSGRYWIRAEIGRTVMIRSVVLLS